MRKKIFTFLLALVASVGMSYALTPLNDDTWDEDTKTLTVNSNPDVWAYMHTEIQHLVFSDAVTSIGGFAFYGCTALTSITIGNNVESIGARAFMHCSALTSITIPASVTSIGDGVFSNCSALQSIYIEAATPPTLGEAVFENDNNLTAIYVPAASVDAYKSAWSDYASLIEAIGGEPAPVVLADCGLGWLNVPEGGVVGTIGHEDEIVLPQVNASLDFILAFQAHTATLRLGSTDESVLAVYGFNNFAVNGVGECDVYVVHDEDAVFAYDSAAFHVTVNPEPTPQPAEDVNITPNVDPDHAGVYYSTFFDSANKYALPAGVEAYVATRDGANLLLSKIAVAGQTIPANNAVILKSTVTPFTLSISDAEAVPVNAINHLQGTDESINTPANCYVLAGNDGVGFYHYTASMLNPHKAYVIYSGSQAPHRMPFVFNQATGVDNVSAKFGGSEKILENGVLYIIKNGVKYNAQGQIVK